MTLAARTIVPLLLFLLAGSETTLGQAQTVAVGRIAAGEARADFRVKGQVEFAADGSALLVSGAELEVRSGIVRLAMPDGQARFCGPARATLLKGSEGGPLLLALESGGVELEYSSVAANSIQTPFFTVSNLPAAEAAPRRLAVRVAASGETCVAALVGSLRVREQFGPSDLLLPPGKAMEVPTAGVEQARPVESGACGCGASPVPQAILAPSSSRVESKTTIATAPLVYQADSSDPPRTGTQAEPVVTLPVIVAGEARSAAAGEPTPPAAKKKPRSSFGAKLKSFFRALFGAR